MLMVFGDNIPVKKTVKVRMSKYNTVSLKLFPFSCLYSLVSIFSTSHAGCSNLPWLRNVMHLFKQFSNMKIT
jgi:hypothetical protein